MEGEQGDPVAPRMQASMLRPATNNQGSWLGEGFGYEPGYVQRQYKPCQDDGHDNVGDLCWSHDNAMISLNGRSRELVRDGDSWRFASDDGSKIERFTGAANGDNDGEHWKVTSTDGTQYFFGLGRLPGWSDGKTETASTWTVPVFGDDDAEPCHQAVFDDAYCQQGWRWNLDYVKDRRGNVSSYFYKRETNHYARGRKTDVTGTAYHRGGWLERIDYGQRDGAVYSTNAPARVVFHTRERCIPTAEQACRPEDLTNATSLDWQDVPWERNCAANTRCKSDQASPTFWTRRRVSEITTEIRAGQGWTPVDSWALSHLFTNNADGSRTLWLESIVHKGRFGGDEIAMPSVQLLPKQLPNRIDIPNDNVSPLIRPRLNTVYTDSGGQIDIKYADADCAAGSLPTPGSSTGRCYPVKWHPTGEKDPVTDWFHKYVVERVTESDRTTVVPGTSIAPEMVTQYDYLGDAAWRHAKPDGITDLEYLSWSEWRGYEKVQVRRGAFNALTTRAEHTYLRGMHGDQKPGGGTREVPPRTDSVGVAYTDHDELAGFEIETAVYDGDRVISKSTTKPWRYETASHTSAGGTDRAFFVLPEVTRNFTALEAGGWRETKSITAYDTRTDANPYPVGRAIQVEDLGDVGTATDDRCTRTFYADNAVAHLRSLVSRAETVAVNCSTTPDRSTQVITDNRTWFDGAEFGVAPTLGNPTRTEKLASHDGATPTYVVVGTATFDAYGRPRIATDAAGSITTLDYTEVDGLTTKRVQTSPKVMVGMVEMAFVATTEYVPAWGVPAAQIDWNGKRTDMAYDQLGRVVGVWLADRSRAFGFTPSIKYTYKVQDNAPVAVQTEKKKNSGEYVSEYQIYDGFLRPRQVQTDGPDGGRLVAETYYTPTGQIAWTNDKFYAKGRPSDQLLPTVTGNTKLQLRYAYDGADRVTKTTTVVSGEEKWHTLTTYGGDRTHVDPPQGGTPTTTITNARGQVTHLLQYKGDGPAGEAVQTTYTHTPAGQPDTVRDAAGNVWDHDYDQRGRKVRTVDPDTGTSIFTYNDLDQLVTVKDARDITLTHTYDPLGRKTATYNGPPETGTKLATWTYDEGYKGHIETSTRYVDGQQYRITTVARDALYRIQDTEYNIPKIKGAEKLGGRYRFYTTYNTDGTVQGRGYPKGGGLSSEAVIHSYDDLQRPAGLRGANSYLGGMKYGLTGELLQVELNTGDRKAWATYTYEEGTQRLKRSRVSRQQTVIPGDPTPLEPAAVTDERYSHDAAGNVLSISDVPAGGKRDTQCFEYDYLRRMTEAWATAKEADDPCAGGAGAAVVGGPAPYHHSYTYDVTGNRKTETLHATEGTLEVKRTYDHPKPGAAQPHRLDSVTESTTAGNRLYGYEYDNVGNLIKRSRASVDQKLDWDAEGHLASVTEGDKSTAFIYTADGDRLVRKEPTATTLYLPGMELRLDRASDVVDGTRFYLAPDGSAVLRTIRGLQFQVADHHGTGQVGLDAVTGELTRRRFTPFGVARGAPPAAGKWVGEKGFVGGTADSTTGLTHLGAREYDAEVGRFVSVDPVIDVADPQQMHGYAYSNNSPASFSDANGLRSCSDDACGAGADYEDSSGVYHEVLGHNDGCGGCSGASDPRASYGRGGSSGGGGSSNPQVAQAQRNAHQAKQQMVAVAKELGKILLKELGVTDALDCFTTGSADACGETAMNVAGALLGGLIGKIVARYGAPWKWAEGAALLARLKDLGGKLISAAKKWWDNSKTAKALARDCTGNSFAAGTLVVLADGTRKRIEEVNLRDVVRATDPETGETAGKAVVATIIGDGVKDLVKVEVGAQVGGKVGSVVATAGHPFWVPELRQWKKATDLRAGQGARSAGTRVPLSAVNRWTETARVYNLTIRGIPTYYVMAGNTPVLVHNCPGGRLSDPLPQGLSKNHVNAYEDIRAGNGVPQIDPRTGQQAVFQGRGAHERRWAGSLEYRVPGAKGDQSRILSKTLPDGRQVMGWTNDHYRTIHPFTAPHFPDAGW